MDKVEVKVFWFDIHLDHCMGEEMGEDLIHLICSLCQAGLVTRFIPKKSRKLSDSFFY